MTAQAVASVASSVCGVRTSSTSGSTATGLKKCIPTTRSGCSRSAPISVTESEDVFVARTHSGETTRSSSAKTSFFTAISSNTASSTRSQPAKTSQPGAAGDERAEEARLALAEPALGGRARRARRGSRRPRSSTCSCVRSRSTTGTSSRRSTSSASWRAISPAPTMPDLAARGAARPRGSRRPRFARRSTRSNA